jgi:hypothetical protein
VTVKTSLSTPFSAMPKDLQASKPMSFLEVLTNPEEAELESVYIFPPP